MVLTSLINSTRKEQGVMFESPRILSTKVLRPGDSYTKMVRKLGSILFKISLSRRVTFRTEFLVGKPIAIPYLVEKNIYFKIIVRYFSSQAPRRPYYNFKVKRFYRLEQYRRRFTFSSSDTSLYHTPLAKGYFE